MKSITYIGKHAEVEFEQGSIWRTAVNGEPIDVPDDLADSLLEQSDQWAAVKAVKATTTKKAQPAEKE